MEKPKKRAGHFFPVLITLFAILAILSLAIFYYLLTAHTKKAADKNLLSENRNYHIIVTGNYENELFLSKVYDGANNVCSFYNAVAELYVPRSQAEELSSQSLFDYASFVNADCVIAYIDSSYDNISTPTRYDGNPIPIVTTGQYNPNLPQISFIGNSYWELGKKLGDEAVALLEKKGRAIIISEDTMSNINYSSLMNSIQDVLREYEEILYSVKENITPEDLKLDAADEKLVLVCITEENTIRVVQTLIELHQENNKNIRIIGFGTNETCQLYLEKNIINELIALDPEKIGEAAIREFFEYKEKGYANSYIAADVKITRSSK